MILDSDFRLAVCNFERISSSDYISFENNSSFNFASFYQMKFGFSFSNSFEKILVFVFISVNECITDQQLWLVRMEVRSAKTNTHAHTFRVSARK